MNLKVLQLCLRIPEPATDGGAMAMKAIAESLITGGATVKLLAFNTKKHFVDPQKISPDFMQATNLEWVYLDATVKIVPAFLNLFSRQSYNIQRFISAAFSEKLAEILKNNSFDIIQLESIYLAPYVHLIRKNSKAKIVLRAHNVEYLIWERLAEACHQLFYKKYLRLLSKRLKTFEISMLNRYDAILPITEEDKKQLLLGGCNIPLHVAPFGINTEALKDLPSINKKFSVFHLGSMDWLPNLQGVDWFLNTVWPLLIKEKSDMVLFLAGKNMPKRLSELSSVNFIVEGLIEDSHKYMSDKGIMIVPLFSGSGMRVKIIEGMALGKTIISTSIGAEGIACSHLKNILIADTKEDFFKWIMACYTDKDLVERIGKEARLFVEESYSTEAIGRNLIQFYNHLLTK